MVLVGSLSMICQLFGARDCRLRSRFDQTESCSVPFLIFDTRVDAMINALALQRYARNPTGTTYLDEGQRRLIGRQ